MTEYLARKDNRLVRINEDKVSEYLNMGYSVTDAKGKSMGEARITDLDTALAKINELKEELAELKAKKSRTAKKETKEEKEG